MPQYLVTGAAGFIASRVIELLLADGHTVVGIDNLNDAYDGRLKQWRLERIKSHPGFSFHRLDVSDRPSVEGFGPGSKPYEAVINLAARAGVRYSVENPWVYLETNVTGTLNLLEFCRCHEIPKFVLASTSSLYGAGKALPYTETANTDHPLSPYAASKKAAEALCYSYHHLYGLDVSVLRYFTVYGPAGRPDMSIFRFIQWIAEGRRVTVYGDGSQSRDFTFIDDIARGTIAAVKPLGCEIVNLGSDRPMSVSDMIRLIERLLGKHARIDYQPSHRADVEATWADVNKARSLLGWTPRTVPDEGVRSSVDWYRENRDWAREISTD